MVENNDLLYAPTLYLRNLPPEADLVDDIRRLTAHGVSVPWIWDVTADGPEHPVLERAVLTVGVRGDVGALQWHPSGSTSGRVPDAGLNDDWVDYYLAGLYYRPVPPGAEVPIEVVYSALSEFLTSGLQPTCLEWRGVQTEDTTHD